MVFLFFETDVNMLTDGWTHGW